MMLGPMKKKMITTGIIAFLIPCIIFGVIFYLYNSKKNAQISELNDKIADTERYVFSGDFSINHVVGTNDVKLAGVKNESAALNTYSKEQINNLVGRRLKIPVKNKTLITSAMFLEEEDYVNADVRIKEFNMIALPSDLQQYDYIDVRIVFPTGEDYLVVAGKEIKQLGTGTESNSIFLELSEEDIVRLSSAIIESYISDSVHVYAVKYVNPYEQLFEDRNVNYVAKYQNAVSALLEELNTPKDNLVDEETGERIAASGNLIETVTEASLTSEEIALKANMSVNDVIAIRKALKENDTVLLDKYRETTETVEKTIVENYPVRGEVAKLVANNPNILDSLKAKYNVETLEAQRDGLPNTSIYKKDEYTGATVENEEALKNVAAKLETEIKAQRTERKEYLQSLIRDSMVTTEEN